GCAPAPAARGWRPPARGAPGARGRYASCGTPPTPDAGPTARRRRRRPWSQPAPSPVRPPAPPARMTSPSTRALPYHCRSVQRPLSTPGAVRGGSASGRPVDHGLGRGGDAVGAVVCRRGERLDPPPVPKGEVTLQAPPALPRPTPRPLLQ